MAEKATIFKAEIAVSDIDGQYYATHTLTIARHPSETDERMMVRLAAFALHADERLTFGGGVSSTDEPALWRRDLTGQVLEWIEVGLPEPRALKRASGRANTVRVYTYGRGAEVWWKQNANELGRIERLSVTFMSIEATQALA
ncbi:MAG: YaeQ family protein, partial [Burkholderiales bacterium]